PAIPGMLDCLGRLDPATAGRRKDYPFILAAGQRRMVNANQIFRDPAWRRDDPEGALLVNAKDLASLGAAYGEWFVVKSPEGHIVAWAKCAYSGRAGQIALP